MKSTSTLTLSKLFFPLSFQLSFFNISKIRRLIPFNLHTQSNPFYPDIVELYMDPSSHPTLRPSPCNLTSKNVTNLLISLSSSYFKIWTIIPLSHPSSLIIRFIFFFLITVIISLYHLHLYSTTATQPIFRVARFQKVFKISLHRSSISLFSAYKV